MIVIPCIEPHFVVHFLGMRAVAANKFSGTTFTND
jgi:hypothetical protein